MNSSAQEKIDDLENDEYFKNYFNGNQKTNTKDMSINDQVKKLSSGIELLSSELQTQVLENYHDLLTQANHATQLENVINTMKFHVQNLFANAERLKSEINLPYQTLQKHTTVLERLHLASHILRQVNRIQQLSKRLSNISDSVQKATILYELEQLSDDPDIQDVDAVIVELRNVRSQQQKLIRLATGTLTQGLLNENAAQATNALQIFINLGTVKTAINNTVDIALGECKESIKSVFLGSGIVASTTGTASSKSGPGRVTLTNSQGFRNRIWVDLEKAFADEIYQQCKLVKYLQSVIDNMETYGRKYELKNVASGFWDKLREVVVTETTECNASIQQMLQDDYPKLLKCYFELSQKLNYVYFPFRHIFDNCETSYLSSSLNRMLEPTQAMFNFDSFAPSHDDIDSLLRILTNELTVALVEDALIEKIIRNLGKSIKLFAVKTEQKLSTGAETAQVIGGATNAGQQQNVQLANASHYFKMQIQRYTNSIRDNLSTKSMEQINDSLEHLDNLTNLVVQPLVVSVNYTIETILITIHQETDWTKLSVSNRLSMSCSPYMRELIQFITRVYQTYFANFENKEILSERCNSIAIRTLDLLSRHASILRPIGEGGRARLHADFVQLENTLRTVMSIQLAELGVPYRRFKSMASLVLIAHPAELAASQTAGSSMPYSYLLLLLFGHALSTDLVSPHQAAGWSVQRMSEWWDSHTSEKDRLDLIAGALQRYESLINHKNLTNFDPIYPIMSDLLSKAIKECLTE